MGAQKAAPPELVELLAGRAAAAGGSRTQLEHVEEARVAQLAEQHLLVLGAGEGARDQRQERFVLALEHVPAVLQAGDARVSRAQRVRGSTLRKDISMFSFFKNLDVKTYRVQNLQKLKEECKVLF